MYQDQQPSIGDAADTEKHHMTSPCNVIIVEDVRADFVLVERFLARNGLNTRCTQVSTPEELSSRLAEGGWNLVLSDYYVPGMAFGDTLSLLKHHPQDIPIIIISGTIGEEQAVELLKLGVADFILKNNLTRLVPAVTRALREADDRHARIAAQEKLREQANLLDAANDAIIVRSLDNRILYWNKAAERQYGWSADEVLGRNVMDVLYSVSRLSFEEALAILLEHGDFSGRITHSRRNGTKAVVQSHWILVRDEEGSPKSILAIHTDLTDRLDLEEKLFQAQKLEALGQLTGGIAHDFNNLLTVIIGNAEILEEELGVSSDFHELAKMIRKSGQRGAELINRLLAFARRQMLEAEVFKPCEIIANLRDLMRRTIGEHIQMRIDLDPEPWAVSTDPAQFEAALLNLCINARDAMPDGGELAITVRNVYLDQERAQGSLQAKPGNYVLVAVSDTGHGMPHEVLARAFEPFFTTKGTGKRSGLGLSMVYGFVMQSRGHIDIDSKVGNGTVVNLYLPQASASGVPSTALNAEVQPNKGTETILLVEDDDMVRAHAMNVLKGLGYQVIAARNGKEALALLREGTECDLLFTDVVMPGGVNGVQLAHDARRLRAGLPVVFTSGHTAEINMNLDNTEPGFFLLHKPYRRDVLASKIRAALDGRARGGADGK